jgi:tetratricopeptide (TPR) repeat protein
VPQPNWRNLWVPAAILAATLLVYSNSFSAGFALDNKPILLQDPRVQASTSENISNIFHHTYWWPTGESGLYRPVTTLSYLFNYSILDDRDQPAGYHWINLLLHASNAILFYFLLLRLTANMRIAALAALLWCIHPVLTESVTNIVGRADLLASLALLSGLLHYLRSADERGWKRAACIAILAVTAALGYFCKESAAVLPGLILLLELAWWKDRAKQRSRMIPALVAVLAPLGLFLYCRLAVLSSSPPADFPYFDNPIVGAAFWTARFSAVKVLARYLAIILWPARLSADYSYNQIPLARGTPEDWLSCAAIVLAAAAAVWSYRKNRAAFYLACLAFLTILPGSNLLFPIGTMMAERLAYLPAAGVVACLVIALNRWPSARGVLAICCLAACGLAARTWTRNQDWQSQLSLARATATASPNSFKAHQILAETLFLEDPEHRDLDTVLSEAGRGIAILDPLPDERSSPELYRLAGACYLLKGDRLGAAHPDAARAQYQSALRVLERGTAILTAIRGGRVQSNVNVESNVNDDLYRLLSAAQLRLGDDRQALSSAQEARQRDPLNPDVYSQLADALERSGDAYQAAGVLMQGMLVTSNLALRKQLIEIYQSGLDQQHCAVINGPAGPAINPACGLVRRQLCEISADAVSVSVHAGNLNTARSLKNSFVRDYGCAVEPLNRILPN